jgi:hypothetical protein
MTENNALLIKFFKDFSKKLEKIEDLIDRNPSLFLSKLHNIISVKTTRNGSTPDREDTLLTVLSVIADLLDRDVPSQKLLVEIKKSSNKFIIIDIIHCAKFKVLILYLIRIFNRLSLDDELTRAVIETELYATSLDDNLSEEASENVRIVLEQFSHRSKATSPRRTPTNKEAAPNFWIGCLSDVSTQISSALENLQNAHAVLPRSFSPPSLRISFVPRDVVSCIIAAKESEEVGSPCCRPAYQTRLTGYFLDDRISR